MKRLSRSVRLATFVVALLLIDVVAVRAASMVDPTFKVGTGGDWYVEHVLEQPDGKILICGLLSKYNDTPMPYIGRLNADGSIDTSFHAQPNYWVRHMILLPDKGGKFQCMFQSQTNGVYTLQFKESIDSDSWTSLPDSDGAGDSLMLEDDNASAARFYRVQARQRL